MNPLRIPRIDALPPATKARVGLQYHALGVPFVCVNNGDDTYSWQPLVGASSAQVDAINARAASTYYDTDYGLVGDGVTDDSAAFQAMLDAVPAYYATRVVLTKRSYYLGSNVTTTKPGLSIEGQVATGQDTLVGVAGTRLLCGSGVIGLTFGSTASQIFNGPTIHNLAFVAQAGAVGGLRLLRTNNALFKRVIATGFSAAGAFGFRSDGDVGKNQYNTMIACGAHNCRTGLDLIRDNGMTLLGGYFDGNSNGSGTPALNPPGTGSIAIKVRIGDTLRAIGVHVQFYDTAYDLEGEGHHIDAPRIEAVDVGIRIAGDFNTVMGGSFNNYIRGLGSVGTAIQIETTADYTMIMVPEMNVFATKVNDLGTNTTRIHSREIRLATGALLAIGAANLTRHTTDGTGFQTNGNLFVGSGLLMDRSNTGKSIFFGPADDVRLYRLAADALAIDVADTFTTGRNVTASRPSASARGAGAMFYDTTLGKPIWSNGTNWRDAAGTVV